MGAKSSSAPPPDPRLIDAQIKSMGYQDDAINQITKNSADLLPTQKDQLEFGLKTSKQAYDDSQSDRTFMLDRRGMLSALQDKIAGEANNFNEAGRTADLRTQGQADVETGLSSARDSAMRDASRRGLNTAKIADAFSRQAVAGASAKSQAGFMARNAAHLEGLQLTDRANNALAGYPSMAMAATGAGAGYGASGVGLANAGLAGQNSGYGAAGGLAGQMGQNASGMYSAMGNYKSAQDKITNDANPMNAMLGAAVSVGASKLMSDRRLKTDIRAVGKLDNGLTVYRYRYKAGGPVHIGVMADEVAKVRPEAYVKGAAGGFDAVDYGKL